MSEQLPEIPDGVDQDVIDAYAELSGDYNPLHVDQEVAKASQFGGTIAHGPIALQAFFRSATAWLGTETLPAGATVKVTYRAPVRPGDTVRCVTRGVRTDGDTAQVDADCVNQDDMTVVTVSAFLPRGA